MADAEQSNRASAIAKDQAKDAINPERWRQIKRCFAAALELEARARQSFLDRECAGDSALRVEVESLLAFAEPAVVTVESPPAEHTELAAGTRLGDYEVVTQLGPGGFGGAYHARDLRLHRDVAIKVLPAALSADAAALRRFQREARAAAQLNHPHIVTIHSIEQVGDVHLIVMELVEGETLDRIIPQGGVSLEKFLALAAELSDAVAAASQKGIIHRDLKPSNIMVDKRGSIKILDFGIAKLTKPEGSDASDLQETEPGVVIGTFPYMSPEQLEGKKLDGRTDIFSLGAVMYQMATGERPFRGKTQAELISSILRDEPKSVLHLRSDLPIPLQGILERCLAKEVEKRYTALQLRESIQQLRQELATKQHSASINSTAGTRVRSLAVLPLENLSRDPEQEYFADGLTEALINSLAKIAALQVISRTTAMRYKKTDKTLPQIARELNVDAIVEGTVLRSGERVRISVQLIDAHTDTHLWAQNYDRDLRDILALHAEVAQAVAREVQVKLTPHDYAHFAHPHPVDPEAYEAYLKGRYYWNRRPAELGKAIQCLEQAITRDPGYAAALTGLADCLNSLTVYGLAPASEGSVKAKHLAQRALEIGDSLAEAHTALALATIYEYDFSTAEKEFERAIELNPRYAYAHAVFSNLLAWTGRYEEAYTEAHRALRLDPLSSITNSMVGWVYLYGRRYDQAIEQLQKTLELDPRSGISWAFLGWAQSCKSQHESAITSLRKSSEIYPGSGPIAWLGQAYATAGYRGEALKILEQLQELSKQQYVSPYGVGRIYAALGQTEEAFLWLETAYEQRANWMVWLKFDPVFDDLRSDPHFQNLLRRMNFLV
jgi:serine/threonine protein kinase/Tfp pilus assembly protein PilF